MQRLFSDKCFSLVNIFLSAICLLGLYNAVLSQNKPSLKKYKIEEKVFQYKIGATIVKIVVGKTSKLASKFVYFNMHDNENTAVEAAKKVIEKYGGTLIELQTGGERLINFSLEDKNFTFDPNRIFTEVGIEKTLKKNGSSTNAAKDETSKFAEKLKEFLKDARLIIAVHNNTDENYSIKSYEKNGEFAKDIKLVNIDPEIDIDDFFYVTEDNFFKFLKRKNQNVALQDNEKVSDDGSLSVYCGRNKISYINVESEHEHLSEQIKMIETLHEITNNFSSIKRKRRSK